MKRFSLFLVAISLATATFAQRIDVKQQKQLKPDFKLDLPGDAPFRFLFDSGARPLFTEQAFELMRLASLRQVSLRERLLREAEEARKDPDEKLRNRVAELEVLLKEYRARYREDTGGDIDEKEVLFG